MQPLDFKRYVNGEKPEGQVIVLHGGPAAPGYLRSFAEELTGFEVFEPYQRGSGEIPLTVEQHISDLHDFITLYCPSPPAIVGHSWGAMLALAHAAKHPNTVKLLALVGCGTFDAASREKLVEIINSRMTDEFKRRIEELSKIYDSEDEILAAKGKIFDQLYAYDQFEKKERSSGAKCDKRAFDETWNDMLLLQKNGVYPEAFSKVTCPVTMLHGSYDPHPGKMIRDNLASIIPQLSYIEFEKCGHTPWKEKAARAPFFTELLRVLRGK